MNKAKLKCPMCGGVSYKESVEALLREIDRQWEPWREFLTVTQMNTLEEYNNPDKWKKILEEEGCIKMFCPGCALIATVEAELKKDRSQVVT